jgi:hypothetical protein
MLIDVYLLAVLLVILTILFMLSNDCVAKKQQNALG